MRQQQQASAQARAAAALQTIAEKKRQSAIRPVSQPTPVQPPLPRPVQPPVRDPKLIVDPNPPKPPLPVQPKPLAEFTRPTSTSPRPPVQPKHYGEGEFNDFGFDRPLLDYLNKQQEMSTYDAGISYQYDPATQTFTGGTRGYGPIKKTLQEMQAESQSKTPSRGYSSGPNDKYVKSKTAPVQYTPSSPVQSRPPPQPQGNYDGQSLIDPDEGGTGGNYDDFKKGGQVKAAQDTKKKYTSGGKINLNECRVSTTPKGKTNPNW